MDTSWQVLQGLILDWWESTPYQSRQIKEDKFPAKLWLRGRDPTASRMGARGSYMASVKPAMAANQHIRVNLIFKCKPQGPTKARLHIQSLLFSTTSKSAAEYMRVCYCGIVKELKAQRIAFKAKDSLLSRAIDCEELDSLE